MHIRMKIAAVTVACAACFLAGHVAAQDEPAGGAGGFEMPEWAKKGPEHAQMAKGVGDWDVAQKMWMAPDQPPMEMAATASTESLYDGRYFKTTYHGDMMGTPFEGSLLLGYDRVDSEYIAVWIDSMSTYVSVSRGKDHDGAIVYEMNDPDWMTGKKKKSAMTQKWINDDQYTLVFSEPGPDGESRTTMEFTYTRKKADTTTDE